MRLSYFASHQYLICQMSAILIRGLWRSKSLVKIAAAEESTRVDFHQSESPQQAYIILWSVRTFNRSEKGTALTLVRPKKHSYRSLWSTPPPPPRLPLPPNCTGSAVTEMPTSGHLKPGNFFFCTSPTHPPVKTQPRPHPTSLKKRPGPPSFCIHDRLGER